jgi:hypothetical protein
MRGQQRDGGGISFQPEFQIVCAGTEGLEDAFGGP